MKSIFSGNQIKQDNENAIEFFGLTSDFSKAGYILPDGKLLDFSDGQNTRIQDHREVYNCMVNPPGGASTQSLIQFMQYGNIRVNVNGLDIMFKPTTKQKQAIIKMIREMKYTHDYIYIDISDIRGNEVKQFEYHVSVNPAKIINDIMDYFKVA